MAKKKKGTTDAKPASACDAKWIPADGTGGMFPDMKFLVDTPEQEASYQEFMRTFHDLQSLKRYIAEEAERVATGRVNESVGMHLQAPDVSDALYIALMLDILGKQQDEGDYDRAIISGFCLGVLVQRMRVRKFDEQIKARESARAKALEKKRTAAGDSLAKFRAAYKSAKALNSKASIGQMIIAVSEKLGMKDGKKLSRSQFLRMRERVESSTSSEVER